MNLSQSGSCAACAYKMLSSAALAAAGTTPSSSGLVDTLLLPPGHAYTFGPAPGTVANGAKVSSHSQRSRITGGQGMEPDTLKGSKCQVLFRAPAFCSGLTSVHVPFHGSDEWAFYLDSLARSAIQFNYSASPALTTTGVTEEVPKACAAVMQALTCARYFQRCDPDNPEAPEVDFCPCRSLCDQLQAMACPAADELDCSAQSDGPTMSCFSSESTCTGYTLVATDGALRLGTPAPPEETEEDAPLRSTLEAEMAQEAAEQAAAAAVEARAREEVAAAGQGAQTPPEPTADSGAQPERKTAQEGSADGAARCRQWAEAGECEANPAYMQTECRQACAAQQRAEEQARAVAAGKDTQETSARSAAGSAEKDTGHAVAARAVAAPTAEAAPSTNGLGDKPFATPSFVVAARAATKAATEATASTRATPLFGGSATAGTAAASAAAAAAAATAAFVTEKPWRLGINGVQPPPFALPSVEAATKAALGANGLQPLPFATSSVELAARAAARVSAPPPRLSVEESRSRS